MSPNDEEKVIGDHRRLTRVSVTRFVRLNVANVTATAADTFRLCHDSQFFPNASR